MYEMNIKITELIPIANETQSDDYIFPCKLYLTIKKQILKI